MHRQSKITIRKILIAAVLMSYGFVPMTFAQDCGVYQPVESNSPAMLVDRLKSDRFSDRQSAMYAIMSDPQPMIPLIEVAIQNGDADFRFRSLKILSTLARGLDRDLSNTSALAFKAIERISRSSDVRVARHADDAKFRILLERQFVAAKCLERLNAKVSYSSRTDDSEFPIATVLKINQQWRGNRRDLELVGSLIGITQAELCHEEIDDKILTQLSQAHGLTKLKLCRCSITNAGLACLSEVGTLQELELLYCPVGTEGLEALFDHEKLTLVRLVGTNAQPNQGVILQRRFASAKIDIRRGAFMGIRYSPTTPECKLTSLVPGSGADVAGLRPGDTIVEFNGNPIREYLDVTNLLRECKAGEQVQIKAKRAGLAMQFSVVMGDWE